MAVIDRARPRRNTGFVYFLLCENGGEDFLKIGYAKDVRKRVAQLQTGSPFPLELMGYIAGNFETERSIHRECKRQRKFGEWFSIDGPVFHRMLEACENQYWNPL